MLRSKPTPSLDYLRPSPVRGQLEPQDSNTAKGWRYLQTTDTVDEFKVLLPPHTAAMYEQLLKLESLELAKKNAQSDRILEIRHLKERMVRKCQKLSKDPMPRKHSHNEPFRFQTISAPADFRLKEMEKWFRQQQLRLSSQRPATPRAARAHPAHSKSSCCHRCSVSPRLGATKNFTSRRPNTPEQIRVHPATSAGVTKEALRAEIKARRASPEPKADLPKNKLGRTESLASISTIEPVTCISPPPLPYLLRRDGVPVTDLGASQQDEWEDVVGPSTPPAPEVPPNLRRRRSCIKRSNTGDSVKTVSWADDRELTDRVAKFTGAAKEVHSIEHEWEDIRQVYVHHMDKLEALESQVQESLARLQSETMHLQTVCESIRGQKESLQEVVMRFGEKHSDYRTKVRDVLQEADGLLSLYGVRNNS
ncbi:hypothetical protein Moror_17201 [Moniliophthora roreri MCA 2997]|uniref:Uncharacterized protein n=2 Tax=Moniliophthora roreri TaxID=221103 RepID=V2Z1S5_MONRO|nr:hypothetical protein Moror_17201 [Moniliophthora roreri MCA 2997]KAI3622356.1 hypothetical protein WG66_015234 [Moniliophthora roreri]